MSPGIRHLTYRQKFFTSPICKVRESHENYCSISFSSITPSILGVARSRGSLDWNSIADFERDFDQAAGCFADQLLRLQHALSGHELQRRHPRGLLEHA